ncbi:MAG: sialate O-acetylesterase [Bacteroidales bacterium]|nr:sialate O-acetylesterase [Bacteroidales bacterium]
MNVYKPITSKDIVFLGDSLTESFELKVYFQQSNLFNRGMAGNATEHLLYRLEEITLARPYKLFLMIGVNDLFYGKSPSQVFDGIIQIVEIIMKETPHSLLYLQSILPVNEEKLFADENINVEVYKLNNLISGFCGSNKHLQFIDLHSHFLGINGQMDPKYTFDGVHLTPAGYTLWATQIKHLLA